MENKVRLIDANLLEVAFGNAIKSCRTDLMRSIYSVALKAVNDCPTVDAVEVVHSRWKFNTDGSGTCENCHFTQHSVWDYDNHQRYCGVCGARMDLEE